MGMGLKTNTADAQIKMKYLNTSTTPLNEQIGEVNTKTTSITSSVGRTDDAGATASTGTLMGKLNNLINSIASVFTNTQTNNFADSNGTLSQKLSYMQNQLAALSATGFGAVKNVQRGVSTKGDTNENEGRSIQLPTNVNPNKSIVLLNPDRVVDEDYQEAIVTSFNGSTITIQGGTKKIIPAYGSPTYRHVPISWQVIEFY